MRITQSLGRVGLSIVFAGAMFAACDDDDDNIDTDTNAQRADAGEARDAGPTESGARAGRGGSGGNAARAGTGGSGGAVASAGRGGAGSGGSSAAANGGSGGRAAGGAGGTTAASGTGGSGGAGGATATRTLTDAQIAAVTTVANSGEVDLGTLAVARAVLPAVRDFAQMMVTMHTAAQTRQSAVLATLGVQIAPNPISTQLEADAMALRGQLTSASAAAFDRAYIQSQVDVHMRVLTTFDEQLLPNATAPALRADLMLARGEVAAHLALARTLLATLDDLSDAGVP